MKVIDIIKGMKVGAVVTDKRLLSALKKKGLIFDYSEWGYLESCQLCYPYKYNGVESTVWDFVELFPKGNAPKIGSVDFKSYEEMREFRSGGSIEYQGCKFDTKYLDGCFCSYLQLVEKFGSSEREVNPRMSLWGAVL